MGSNRRKFLKVAGIGTLLGLGGGMGLKACSYQPEEARRQEKPEGYKVGRWGMVIDTRVFRDEEDFQRAIDACHRTHNVPDQVAKPKQEIKWIWKDHFRKVFPDQDNPYLAERIEEREFLLLCNQCYNPPCVRVCPTNATYSREDGIVQMDFHRCIGCRYCMAGCPYGARSFNYTDPEPYLEEVNLEEFPPRMRGVVEKCLFCYQRLDEGQLPACVEASNGGIIVGDLEDPDSDIRRVLRDNFTIQRKLDLGTEPSVFYIV